MEIIFHESNVFYFYKNRKNTLKLKKYWICNVKDGLRDCQIWEAIWDKMSDLSHDNFGFSMN